MSREVQQEQVWHAKCMLVLMLMLMLMLMPTYYPDLAYAFPGEK